MASAVNPLFGSTAPSTPATQSGTTSPAPSEQMFLQLLVAQMKNQDPTNPSDPTQFVTQLAQFSELEQVIAIRSDIEKTQSTTTTPATNHTKTPTQP